MEEIPDPLEDFWDNLLSRVPERVQSAFSQLDPKEQHAILGHLRKMSSEPGWHLEQRRSAKAALEIIEKRE